MDVSALIRIAATMARWTIRWRRDDLRSETVDVMMRLGPVVVEQNTDSSSVYGAANTTLAAALVCRQAARARRRPGPGFAGGIRRCWKRSTAPWPRIIRRDVHAFEESGRQPRRGRRAGERDSPARNGMIGTFIRLLPRNDLGRRTKGPPNPPATSGT